MIWERGRKNKSELSIFYDIYKGIITEMVYQCCMLFHLIAELKVKKQAIKEKHIQGVEVKV